MEGLTKNIYCINCLCKVCKYNEELTGIKAMNTCDRCKECYKGSKAIELCGKYKKLCNKKRGQNKQ